MAVTDYDTTAANNTSVGGVSIADGWSPPNVNNAIRALMADIAQGIEDGDFAADTAGLQPLDATLTALAGVTTAADKVIYATGADTFATADLTAYGRTLIALANAAALKSALSVVTATSSTLAATGHLALDLTGDGTADIKLNWGTGTLGSSVSFNSNFATSCWGVLYTATGKIGEDDDADEINWVSSKSVSGFTTSVDGDYSSLPGIFYIAIGV